MLIALLTPGFPFLSLPLEIRTLILTFAIGRQLISVSVRNPARLAHIYGTWSQDAELKLESCRLTPPKSCDGPWEDGEGPLSDLIYIRSMEADDYYICKEHP